MTFNRADKTREAIFWDQVAEQAKARAAAARAALATEARSIFRDQGSADTWRLTGVGQVIVSVTKPRLHIAGHNQFVDWVAARRPDEIVTTREVREAYFKALARQVTHDKATDQIVIAGDGEVVPGLEMLPGGSFKGVSIRPDPDAVRAAAAEAAAFVDSLATTLAEPVGAEETP